MMCDSKLVFSCTKSSAKSELRSVLSNQNGIITLINRTRYTIDRTNLIKISNIAKKQYILTSHRFL